MAGSPGRCENGEGPEVRSQREVGPEAAKAGSQRCAMDRAGGGGRAIMAEINTRKGREGRWMGRGENGRRKEGSRSRAVVGKTRDGREE